MSRIRRIAPGLGRGGLLGNTEGPESYLRELDTLPSQFCRATGGTETVIEEGDEAVSLLLNFDGSNGSTTFTDQSIYAHTVTANGGAAISTTQSKFGGASLALDGNSGTYLSLASNSAFTFGTEPFTVEAWVYPISTQQVDSIVSVGTTSLASNWQFYFWDTSSSQTRITWQTDAGTIITSSGYIQMNEWSHVAAVGNGSEVKLFINGQQDGTLSLLYDLSDAAVLRIGLNRGNTRFWPGYIDSLRIVKGKALYTGNFTPPASAPTNKTGKYYRVHTFTDTDPTSLLLNFDGANGSTTFTDDSGWGHAVTANGNAQISTTQSKFGGSSAYFDGTGDYLDVADSIQFAMGSGDFTIEMWLYNIASTSVDTFYDNRDAASPSAGTGFQFRENNGGYAVRDGASTLISTTSGRSIGQWQHFSVSRSGGTLRMFVDGQQAGSSVSYTSTHTSPNLIIGAQVDLTNNFNGYIDSLRITKGQALYTAAFTPPTTALTRVGSGSLTFTRGGAVEYLVVGGGGGGSNFRSGGGGGGGYRCSVVGESSGGGASAEPRKTVSSKPYDVAVGGGGVGGAYTSNATGNQGSSGQASSFDDISAFGGGYGGNSNAAGGSGGSGGGGGGGLGSYSGGSGESSQGYAGGDNGQYGAGGGGGAGAAGASGVVDDAGNGGDGVQSSIDGTATYRCGGGGGGTFEGGTSPSAGLGGLGGGTAGGNIGAANAAANTGGGGGGGSQAGTSLPGGPGGSGGSGIVIARYRITQAEYEAEAA